MKILILLAFVLTALTPVTAQTKIYDENVELRTAKNFNKVHVSGGIDLYLTHGDEAVAVSASDVKYREKIKVEVVNGVLKIWNDDNTKNRILSKEKKGLKAYVSYKVLNALTASGAVNVKVEGSIKTQDLVLNISGGSDFNGKVEVDELKVDLSGATDVVISGSAKKLTVEASGASDFNGYNLNTDVCIINISGASDAEVFVNKELTATASGASDLNFKGNPTVKSSKASGASSISRKS